MRKEAILVCGAGTHREFGLKSLLQAGLRVGVIEAPENIDASAAHTWVPSSVGSVVGTDTLRAVLGEGWDAAVCWGEFAMDSLPELLREGDIRGPVLDVQQVRDKHTMRQKLTAAGFAQPRYRLCTDLAQVSAFQDEMGGQIVMKPIDYAGSAGVRLVDTREEAVAAQQAIELLGGQEVLCEEYLTGREYSCEVLMVQGRPLVVYGITEKFVTAPPVFFELGHAFPAFIDPETREELVSCAVGAAQTLGVSTATVHVELKMTNGVPHVIEVAGRLAGDEIPQLVYLATGLNPFVLEARAVLGENVAAPGLVEPEPTTRAVSICLDAVPGSTVNVEPVRQSIIGTDGFEVNEFHTYADAGETVQEAEEGRVRIGQVVGTTEMAQPELAEFVAEVAEVTDA